MAKTTSLERPRSEPGELYRTELFTPDKLAQLKMNLIAAQLQRHFEARGQSLAGF